MARVRSLAMMVIIGLAGAGSALDTPNDEFTAGMTSGVSGIQSIGPVAVGPRGIVFIGDAKSAAVFALSPEPAVAQGTRAPIDVRGLDAKVAALLGTTPRDIVVRDMAADTATGVVYLSVTRGRGPDALPALVRVSSGGLVENVRLDQITFSKLDLERAPTTDQRFAHPAWRDAKRRVFSVTDLAFEDGQLYISGVTNEEFASSFRRVHFPFDGRAPVTRVSMYHASHGMYETEAPIESFLPVTLGGERVILAGYACTPIATFPLRGLTPDAKVRGTTVLELGPGNRPDDMLEVEHNGERYVLIVQSRRGLTRVKVDDLARARPLTRPVEDTGGAPFEMVALPGVREIEPVSKDAFVVLRMMADSSLTLQTLATRAFFSR